MATVTRRVSVARKRKVRKAAGAVKRSCKCTACTSKKRKKAVKRKTVKRKTTAKRKKTTGTTRKSVRKKTTKRVTKKKAGLGGLEGDVFRLSKLQKRMLSPALQKAIIERQRRLGKTIVP